MSKRFCSIRTALFVGFVALVPNFAFAQQSETVRQRYETVEEVLLQNPELADLAASLVELNKLSELGFVPAIVRLGDIYRSGADGLASDPARALTLFRQAAELGHKGATRRLADMLVRGEGGEQDFDSGVALLEPLAGADDIAALNQLAEYFSNSELGHKDINKATSYLERSSAAGNTSAMVQLGDIYRSGADGLASDPARALTLFRQAAELGHKGAMRKLADIFVHSTVTSGGGSLTTQELSILFEQFAVLGPQVRKEILLRLRSFNPNGYVYFLQRALAAKGAYVGAMTGRLTMETIRQFNLACRGASAEAQCRLGPLNSIGANALIDIVVAD